MSGDDRFANSRPTHGPLNGGAGSLNEVVKSFCDLPPVEERTRVGNEKGVPVDGSSRYWAEQGVLVGHQRTQLRIIYHRQPVVDVVPKEGCLPFAGGGFVDKSLRREQMRLLAPIPYAPIPLVRGQIGEGSRPLGCHTDHPDQQEISKPVEKRRR